MMESLTQRSRDTSKSSTEDTSRESRICPFLKRGGQGNHEVKAALVSHNSEMGAQGQNQGQCTRE